MDGAWRRPTDSSLRSGTPSPSEVPSGGARALWLLWGFSKVTRRQGGPLGGRYLNNGYVPGPTVLTVRPSSQRCGDPTSQLPQFDRGASDRQGPAVRPSSQASQLPHLDRGASDGYASAVRSSREQTPSPQVSVVPKLCRYLWPSRASPHRGMHLKVGATRMLSANLASPYSCPHSRFIRDAP